jgi:hypothetical protein
MDAPPEEGAGIGAGGATGALGAVAGDSELAARGRATRARAGDFGSLGSDFSEALLNLAMARVIPCLGMNWKIVLIDGTNVVCVGWGWNRHRIAFGDSGGERDKGQARLSFHSSHLLSVQSSREHRSHRPRAVGIFRR